MNKKRSRCGKRTIKSRKSNLKRKSEADQHPQMDEDVKPPCETRQKRYSYQFERFASGRRIVSFKCLQKITDLALQHGKVCSESDLKITKETWIGLRSYYHLYCSFCKYASKVCSESHKKSLPINEAAVWGAINGGGGYQSLFDELKLMDIPPMSYRCYRKCEEIIHCYQEKSLAVQIKRNGEEEKQLALKDPNTKYYDGIPGVTVTCDGSWGKRSYGHSYNSLSGSAVIIGNLTGKVLYLGVRNSYCYTCDTKSTSPHLCCKNYSGTSTFMETDIILEGFLKSQDMHGLFYDNMIADQDSSVFVTVQGAMNQKFNVKVQKINCVNHAIRCLKSNLYKMLAPKSGYNNECKSWLKQNISKMAICCKSAIKYNHDNKNFDCSWKTLRNDLMNIPNHIADKHSKCRTYFCKKKDILTSSNVCKDDKFWRTILVIFTRIGDIAQSLIYNERSNKAESFMGSISKYIGGKRKNFYMRNQYTTRVLFAGNSHKQGFQSSRNTFKNLFAKSPLQYWGLKSACADIRPKVRKYKVKIVHGNKSDSHYGEKANKDYMTKEVYEIHCQEYLAKKSINSEKQLEVMRSTIGQSSNSVWFEQRKELLTTSKFYEVVRKQKKTKETNIVKSILYSDQKTVKRENLNYTNDARHYGLYYEQQAKKFYENLYNVKVEDVGLVIDIPNGFLGASPDGLVGVDGMLEIKCPYKARFFNDINKAIDNGEIPYLIKVNGSVHLAKNCSYYFQIVGQLGITGRKWCDFFVFIPDGNETEKYYCERIYQNATLWSLMKPELERFFVTCLLPEIIDPNVKRSMSIRENNFEVNKDLKSYRKSLGPCVHYKTKAVKRRICRENTSILGTPKRRKLMQRKRLNFK